MNGAAGPNDRMSPPEATAGERPTWRGISLAPFGAVSAATLDRLLVELSARVLVPCRSVPCPTPPPLDRVPGRTQIDADRWLERLEAHGAPGAPLVGVTEDDLALPIFTFVFGRARLGGHAAVVSLARLRPEFYGQAADPGQLARRAAAEMLHELGHLAGLRHCEQSDCLMRFAASVEAADLRGFSFCAACAGALPAGFVPRPRPGLTGG